MNAELKAAVKASSLHFGNEQAEYKSTMSDCMAYHGNNNNYADTQKQTMDLKTALRKSNFTLGKLFYLHWIGYKTGSDSAGLLNLHMSMCRLVLLAYS